MQQYIAKTMLLNDDQLYLADMNSDGAISLMDVTALQNVLAVAG